MRLSVAATFTVEPIRDALEHWIRELQLRMELVFAPHAQVFQSLLDTASPLRTNRNGVNVALVQTSALGPSWAAATRALPDLVAALRETARGASVPLLVCICPSRVDGNEKMRSTEAEISAAARIAAIEGVYVILPEDVDRDYPVERVFDAYGESLANVPYSESFFAALATSLARRIHSLLSEPKKVLVVDCDDTLWGGLCAEVGPEGVVIDGPRRALQQFIVDQRDAGMLVCICSRNNEADVAAVFDRRSDMILRREHVTSWKVDWSPKPEGIESIARELGLGIDSFVFIDDDRFVCADVRARCTGITVLQLPAEIGSIPNWLRHLWVFDRMSITPEDRARADFYAQNTVRESLRIGASLQGFLATLELDVRIEPMSDQEVLRIAQLTQRTNQFNATTVRRSEAQLRGLREAGSECLAIHVSDRFGSYGLAGSVVFRASGSSLHIDTFLLSCRVLGRGVEHRVVAELGRIAQRRGLASVRVPFRATERNMPFAQFFELLPRRALETQADQQLALIDAEQAAAFVHEPDNSPAMSARPDSLAPPSASASTTIDYGAIAICSRDVSAVVATMGRAQPRAQVAAPPGAASGRHTEIEEWLVALWRDELGLAEVGLDDDFFDLGGHSLLVIKILMRIHEEFHIALPMGTFFEAPTVRQMSQVVAAPRS